MSDNPASILTKTQRRRLREEFDGVEGAKRRRDEQQIRERIAAGLTDFELLVGHPDRQYELALEAYESDDVTELLGDSYLTLERIRVLEDIDRAEIVEQATERAETLEGQHGIESAADVEFWGPSDRSRRAETHGAGREEPTRWKRLSEALLKLSLIGFGPALLVAAVKPSLFAGPTGGAPVFVALLALIGGLCALFGALAIVAARSIKYDVLPVVRTLVSEPRAVVSSIRNDT